jgi:formylglycine-generating enzyme required for sulfatase activity
MRYSSEPPNLNDDTCRTDEIWLRLVLPGTFMMGGDQKHKVTLTKPYYIGIFEVTQKQWENVNTGPTACQQGTMEKRPFPTGSSKHLAGHSTLV